MSLKNDSLPSSSTFDIINSLLSSDPAERKEAVKKGGAVFAITLKKGSDTDTWYIDLKKEGTVSKESQKADVTLVMSDDDFGKLIAGTSNAQKLFMSGKLKIKGDVMKATRIEPILKRAQTKAKL